MKILDRYVLRCFLEPFLICFLGFFSIWLVFDIQGNLSEFQQGHASLKMIGAFYLTQLPTFMNIVLPVGLLLALLFSLSKMSRSNEIISQLTAGLSIVRVLLPLMGVGLFCTGVLWWLNLELAPHADAIRKVMLAQIQKGRASLVEESMDEHLFRDRQTGRTWYVEKLRKGANDLTDVVIIQQDEQDRIVRKWYAHRAIWDPRTGQWIFVRGMVVEFDLEGQETKREQFMDRNRVIKDWPETPWRIAASNFEAQNLSVPELRQYLEINHDFPELNLAPFRTYLEHRRALPWTCLCVVLIGAPLGIVFNRRGVLAGVASSIFIFFGMIFANNLFLALGKGMRVSPLVAAWTPNLVIAGIGLVLLYFRGSNRDLTTLFTRRR